MNAQKQMRRQSKDFKEILNIQTDMLTTQEKWDAIFHNWEIPEKCAGRKRPTGCSICDKLIKEQKENDSNTR